MKPLLKAQPVAPAGSILDIQRRVPAAALRYLPVDQLSRSQFQPRITVKKDDAFDALVESVSAHGVVQPVVVRELTNGKLELIAGERRLEAAKACGHATIPARILTNVEDVTAQGIALAENCARANLSAWEQAQTLSALKALCASHNKETDTRSLARMVGLSKSLVADLLVVAERLDSRVLAGAARNGSPPELDKLSKAALMQVAKLESVQARADALARALNDKEETVVSAPFVLRGNPAKTLTLRVNSPIAKLTAEQATSLLEALHPLISALESAKSKQAK